MNHFFATPFTDRSDFIKLDGFNWKIQDQGNTNPNGMIRLCNRFFDTPYCLDCIGSFDLVVCYSYVSNTIQTCKISNDLIHYRMNVLHFMDNMN